MAASKTKKRRVNRGQTRNLNARGTPRLGVTPARCTRAKPKSVTSHTALRTCNPANWRAGACRRRGHSFPQKVSSIIEHCRG